MTENMRIRGTMLGYEDHGMLTAFLYLEAGVHQGFGGYVLDAPSEDSQRKSHLACGFWIQRVLQTVGVSKWEHLPGKYVRVERDDGRQLIRRIGNIIEDKWFEPEVELKQLENLRITKVDMAGIPEGGDTEIKNQEQEKEADIEDAAGAHFVHDSIGQVMEADARRNAAVERANRLDAGGFGR